MINICGDHINLKSGVAPPVLASEASLYLISLLQVAYQLVHIEAHTFYIGFDNASAVVEGLGHTGLFILSVASPLDIWLALVLEHHLLDHVAVGVLVHTIAPH